MSARILAVQPVLMSRDVPRSIAFYERMGFTQTFVDSPGAPRYAGVQRDGMELHFQWHDPSEWDHIHDRPTYRFVTDGIDDLHDAFALAGITDMRTPRKTEWGTYEFHVRDPDGNGLQFYRDRA